VRRRLRLPGALARRRPAPFVVGVNRSGTTLLRLMLDAHPDLAIPPETHFVPDVIRKLRRQNASKRRAWKLITSHPRFGDFGLDPDELLARIKATGPLDTGEILRAFYGLYAERHGKLRWGDKTPRYMRAMPRIQRALPEARFIHLIRDGRDVALSQADRAVAKPRPVGPSAARWRRRIEGARAQSRQVSGYLEVRYEDLVTDPEPVVRRICALCKLSFDPAMLRYDEHAAERLRELDRAIPDAEGVMRTGDERLSGHARVAAPPDAARIGRWRREMSAADRAAFVAEAGGMLAELGYEVSAEEGAAADAPLPAGKG
jgi:hypothetical protein